jgi:hypothetical protein
MNFESSNIELAATVIFVLAILHTFLVKQFQKMGNRYPDGSVGENFFHLLGEVEVVFGIWAGVLLGAMWLMDGGTVALEYINKSNFTEPLFVFVIMTVCASRPILNFGEQTILAFSRLIPGSKSSAFFLSALVVGPLLGSLITEPAAMTITAMILLKYFYQKNISPKLMYATLGLLFVNISIGGTLTPYAAPPVLMVAPKWGWDIQFMFFNFGWKAMVAVVISALAVVYLHRQELGKMAFGEVKVDKKIKTPPVWVTAIHLVLLVCIVMASHHEKVFMGLFMGFLGVAVVTKEYQDALKVRESLLVAFFLGGLVLLGKMQAWWLSPVLNNLGATSLYFGAMILTAFTDNAAITFLGSQVEGLSNLSKYMLVAGSVVGGGLTVIANAPNPAGYSLLNSSFGDEGISPWGLFKSALLPTIVAAVCFLLL